MKIKIRLSLNFALIVAAILALFSLSVYLSSEEYRESEFYGRLRDKAISSARLLVDVKEIDSDLLKIIGASTTPLYDEQIVIYDSNDKLIFSNGGKVDSLAFSKGIVSKIRAEGEYLFKSEQSEILGLVYSKNNESVVVIASAIDRYGFSKLKNLKIILFIGFIISILITIFIGSIYAEQALKPISNVINQVDKISVKNLDSRVNAGNGKDEIAQLANTFNLMLERIEAAFQMQRNFVSNASHELRTPLTVIRGEIEVTMLKDRDVDEYQKVLVSILEDVKNLSKLSNGLLDLAQVSIDASAITKNKIRIDELVWQIRTDFLKAKKDAQVDIVFDALLDDEKKLTVNANEELLRTAILNLIDNACKFSSDNKVEVFLGYSYDSIKIEFVDHGIGIKEDELKRIYEPFYRAENAKTIKGHGIGLSLVEKIVKIHQGQLLITSTPNMGTKVAIRIPFSAV